MALILKILTWFGGATALFAAIATVLPAKTVEKWGVKAGEIVEAFLHSKLGNKVGEVIGDKTIIAFARGLMKGMGEL